MAPEVEQVDSADPAFAVGAAVMVIVLVAATLLQPDLATAVKVSVLLPTVLSAVLGL